MNSTKSITNREIINIAYPIIFGNLAQTLITFTDTIFMGHVGATELGASMLAGIYYYVFSTLAWGFAVGIQIIIARRFGEQNYPQIGKVFDHGTYFVAILGALLFLLLHFATEPILKLFIPSPELYEEALKYMDNRHYGIIFVCFNYLFRSFYIGLSNTKVITFTTLLMASVNIFFDYALIFGKFGLPEMKIAGAATASVMAEISAFIFFIFYTLWRLPIRKYNMFSLPKFDTELMKSTLKLSFPTMIQRLISFGMWFIFLAMISRLGDQSSAVSGIVRSVYMLILIPSFAFGATANTLTGRMLGSGQEAEIPAMLRRVTKISILFSIPLALLCVLFPTTVASIYTDQISLAQATVPVIYIICCTTIISAISSVYFEALSGAGNTFAALYLELIVLVIYLVYTLLATIVFQFSLQQVWCAEFIYNTGLGVVSLCYMRFAKWLQKQV